MKKITMYLGILTALGLPGTAGALDMEYVTYDGFDTVVTGFQRLALIFSDHNYLGLFISFAILGIVFGGLAIYTQGMTGQPVSFLGWLLPILIGVAVFQGLILPKGNVAVYDPVRNEAQVVGSVPDAIVLIAGLFNLVERSIVAVVDTASAYPYAEEAGGITFDLMRRATSENIGIDDFLLSKTLGEYVKNCAPVALKSPATSIDEHDLKRGTQDIQSILSQMRLQTTASTVYNHANKWGITTSCRDAWDLHIHPFLGDATFATAQSALCAHIGFNPSKPNQLNACQGLMQSAMQKYGIPVGTYGSTHFVRNIFLAQAIDRAMQDINPDLAQRALANRNLMVQGVGLSNAANEWLPQIRSIMFVVALGMIPILALFIVTPLMGKVMLFTVGLFGWLTLWGITDATLHEMAMDGAIAFYDRHASYGFGLDAIWMTPEASAKAMALFGKTKTYAIMVASVLAMALFKFGGYAFSQMAEGWSRHIEQAGSEAAQATQTPEGRLHKMNEMAQSNSHEALRASHGLSDLATHGLVQAATGVASTQEMLGAAAKTGMSTQGVIAQLGASGGQREISRLLALQDLTEARGGDRHHPGEVGQTAGQFEKIRTVAFGSDMNAVEKAAKAWGGGDMNEGLAKYAYTDAFARYGQKATTRQLVEGMQESQFNTFGKTMPDDEAYQRLAQFQMAETWATTQATQGDSQYLVDLMTMSKTMDLAERESFFKTIHSEGLDPQHVGLTSGLFRGAGNIAQHEAIHDMQFGALVAGYYATTMSQGLRGQAVEQAAQTANLTPPEFIQQVEDMGATREAARLLQLDYLADTFASNNEQAVLMQEGGGQSITLSGRDNVDRFIQQADSSGLISEPQKQFMRTHAEAEGGVKLAYGLDLNDPQQKMVHMALSSGSELLIAHTGRADYSQNIHAGESLSSEAVHTLFTQGFADSDLNQRLWSNVSNTMAADWSGSLGEKELFDSQPARAIIEGLNQTFSVYGAESATSADMERAFAAASVHLGVETKNSPFGKIANWAFGADAGLKASAGIEGNTSDTESAHYNVGSYMMLAGFAVATDMANKELADKGLDIHSSDEATKKAAETLRADYVAEKMTHLHSSYLSHLSHRGGEEFSDSDAYGAVFNQWVENQGTTVPIQLDPEKQTEPSPEKEKKSNVIHFKSGLNAL